MNNPQNESQIEEMLGAAEDFLKGSPHLNEKPAKRTLLETWAELLSNIEVAAAEPVTMQQAMSISRTWPQISIQETPEYHWAYHSNLTIMRDILTAEIESDPDCLKHGEDDGEANRHHYLNLLLLWQKQMLEWEKTWNAADKDSHIWLAAYSSTNAFVLGEQGMVAHLDEIEFEFSDEDAVLVFGALAE